MFSSKSEDEEVIFKLEETKKWSKKLNTFHYRIARKLTGMHIFPDPSDPDEFIYPNMSEVLQKAVFYDIEEYINCRKNTLNISTASSLLLASMNVKVAKHGNKALSSKCGSADVLERLKININLQPYSVNNQ